MSRWRSGDRQLQNRARASPVGAVSNRAHAIGSIDNGPCRTRSPDLVPLAIGRSPTTETREGSPSALTKLAYRRGDRQLQNRARASPVGAVYNRAHERGSWENLFLALQCKKEAVEARLKDAHQPLGALWHRARTTKCTGANRASSIIEVVKYLNHYDSSATAMPPLKTRIN